MSRWSLVSARCGYGRSASSVATNPNGSQNCLRRGEIRARHAELPEIAAQRDALRAAHYGRVGARLDEHEHLAGRIFEADAVEFVLGRVLISKLHTLRFKLARMARNARVHEGERGGVNGLWCSPRKMRPSVRRRRDAARYRRSGPGRSRGARRNRPTRECPRCSMPIS